MFFNSFQFADFFIIVFLLYRILNHRRQNHMLLIASYVFYGAWDWRFLSLIWISTILDYYCGLAIFNTTDQKRKKQFLFLSVFGNLSILGFFKYFNFFAVNLQALLQAFGLITDPQLLKIVLPVGISFYTFQTLSYTIDIYRNELKPTTKFLDFALFVAFFPQLVAGPIERAKHLLPQIQSPRIFTVEGFYQGAYLMFWGLFQKVFVADNLAKIVDTFFKYHAPYNGSWVWVALYAFSFQIYCDFAGYSNIARGIGKMLGFDIMVNFNLPYFATNPRDFWKRWHISLSTFLRDYLYIPLGGNKGGWFKTIRTLMIVMLLGGLWHGASWNFVLWGAYHALVILIYRVYQKIRPHVLLPFLSWLPSPIVYLVKLVFFYHVVCYGWMIFRAQSLQQFWDMSYALFFNFKIFYNSIAVADFGQFLFFTGILMIVSVIQYCKNDLMIIYKSNVFLQFAFYALCFYLMQAYTPDTSKAFIYFQF